MRVKLVLLPVATALLLAACGQSPTAPAAETAAARLDTGIFGGSGNRGDTETATVTEVMAADSTGRGGIFGGSGN